MVWNMKGLKNFGLVLTLSLLAFGSLGWSGCETKKLEPGGVYAPTNAAGQVVSSDLGLALADASYKLAYETTVSVFEFERVNRQAIWNISPEVKKNLDKARPQVVDIDKRWALARKTYREHPTSENLTTVQSILSEINRLLPVVQQQLAPVQTNTTTKP